MLESADQLPQDDVVFSTAHGRDRTVRDEDLTEGSNAPVLTGVLRRSTNVAPAFLTGSASPSYTSQAR
jgi:hypothetical protein